MTMKVMNMKVAEEDNHAEMISLGVEHRVEHRRLVMEAGLEAGHAMRDLHGRA